MIIYPAENIINFRDMGGYPTCFGKSLPTGKVFRGGIPKEPTDYDILLLKRLNIKIILDFRGDKEAAKDPSVFETHNDFEYHRISLLEANPSFNKENRPLWEMYAYSLKNYRNNYIEAYRLLKSFDEPCLISCFFGKDRTGVFAALLLEAEGVSRNYIYDDYSVSYKLIRLFVEKEIKDNTGLIWEQDTVRLRSDTETIRNTLDYVDENYGSVRQYLKVK